MDVHYLLLNLWCLLQEQIELWHIIVFMLLRVIIPQFSWNMALQSTLCSSTSKYLDNGTELFNVVPQYFEFKDVSACLTNPISFFLLVSLRKRVINHASRTYIEWCKLPGVPPQLVCSTTAHATNLVSAAGKFGSVWSPPWGEKDQVGRISLGSSTEWVPCLWTHHITNRQWPSTRVRQKLHKCYYSKSCYIQHWIFTNNCKYWLFHLNIYFHCSYL